MFHTADWANIVNAHSVPGPGVVAGLKAAVKDRNDRACLLIAEMSSKVNIFFCNCYSKARFTLVTCLFE